MLVSGRAGLTGAATGVGRPQFLLVSVLFSVVLAFDYNQQFQVNAYQWPFSSGSSPSSSSSSSSATTTTTTTTTTTSTITSASTSPGTVIRLRGNKLRRPESCRENLPRKSDELPELVATGRVREVYLASSDQTQPSTGASLDSIVVPPSGATPTTNKALVTIGRVIRGNQQLIGSDIIVSGFNSTSSMPCPNYVKPNDTLILLLAHETDHHYSIQGGNLLPMNLSNLDRINAIAADEPYKRRGPIEDILCEAKYCPYGRCVVLNEASGEVTCKCPDSCSSLPAPVCGSDNTTYTNECHLIREGCNRKRPLFVTKESSC